MKKILKHQKTVQGFIYLILFLLISCNDDDNPKTNVYVPTAAEFSSLRDDALETLTQHFQFDVENGYTSIITEKGVTISIDPNCLRLNGNSVTGTIDLDYVEIFDGGNMITTNKSTMGLMNDGNKSLLISGGEFYINATQGGQQLSINCPMTLAIPTSLTNPGGDNTMSLWNGVIDENGNITWEEDTANPVGNEGVFIEGQGETAVYYAYFDSFGWTNVDRFYNDSRPKTTILADVPDGYNNDNSAIYIHYDGEGNALAHLDRYDEETELFSEHYGQIPIGLECHIIFVSEQNDNWLYAIKEVTITANTVYSFSISETSVVTEEQLIDAINALP